jgi:hypothetical protein
MNILVHHCIAQEKIVYGLMEPSPNIKCRCKKKISLKRATKLVADGDASWIIQSRLRGQRQQTCRLCKGSPDVQKCPLCLDKKVTEEAYVEDTPGSDILLISQNPHDTKDKKSFFLKKKTPRAPTIEEGHIERAMDDAEAYERVEEYGWMIQEALHAQGAEVRYRRGHKKELQTLEGFEGHLEPANNAKRGEGRDYDFGRSI